MNSYCQVDSTLNGKTSSLAESLRLSFRAAALLRPSEGEVA